MACPLRPTRRIEVPFEGLWTIQVLGLEPWGPLDLRSRAGHLARPGGGETIGRARFSVRCELGSSRKTGPSPPAALAAESLFDIAGHRGSPRALGHGPGKAGSPDQRWACGENPSAPGRAGIIARGKRPRFGLRRRCRSSKSQERALGHLAAPAPGKG